MLHLEGIPISPGYAHGIAVVYDYEIERRLELPRRGISHWEVETECKRVDDAVETSSQDLKHVEQTALSDPRLADSAALSSMHSAMATEIFSAEQDVRDVGRRMMRDLAGSPPWTDEPLPPGSVIVARELLPSEAVELAKDRQFNYCRSHRRQTVDFPRSGERSYPRKCDSYFLATARWPGEVRRLRRINGRSSTKSADVPLPAVPPDGTICMLLQHNR